MNNHAIIRPPRSAPRGAREGSQAITYCQRITDETWQLPEVPNSRQLPPRTGEVSSHPR